jgi:hypothetical protein
MDVWCVSAFFCVCVVLCLGRGLAMSWSPVQWVLPSVNDQETEKSALSPKCEQAPMWEQRGRGKKSIEHFMVPRACVVGAIFEPFNLGSWIYVWQNILGNYVAHVKMPYLCNIRQENDCCKESIFSWWFDTEGWWTVLIRPVIFCIEIYLMSYCSILLHVTYHFLFTVSYANLW